jgi:hypothetical protein
VVYHDRSAASTIQVYVDRLTKLKRFAAAHTSDGSVKLAGTTLRTIIGPHGMPKSFVSDRDPRITARFWRELSRVLGSDVNLSTAQRAQSDGQSEREIQTPTTALRSYVNAMGDDWDEHLPRSSWHSTNSKHRRAQHRSRSCTAKKRDCQSTAHLTTHGRHRHRQRTNARNV